MELREYISEIKLELTGGVLELELPDSTLCQVVNKALREVQRYITSTELMTIPFASCIDLSDSNVSVVTKIYRTEGYLGDTETGGVSSAVDPMYAQTWMAFTNGGTMYNLNDYVLNYLSYNTLLQMRNTTTTDMAFKYDKQADKLYINSAMDRPVMVTIEYIPIIKDVSEVKSDYWQDIILRLSVALTKTILGKIRNRYKQTNALWTQDGDQMSEEGNKELADLRLKLETNAQLVYPLD